MGSRTRQRLTSRKRVSLRAPHGGRVPARTSAALIRTCGGVHATQGRGVDQLLAGLLDSLKEGLRPMSS